MIKILAVGNSFSQDATALLQLLDGDLFVRNLYIGGCSLETHVAESRADGASYDYEENGADCLGRCVTLKEGLCAEKWDYVTVQQCSGLSGKAETYYPYLTELISYIKKYSDAEIVFHQTWAYEVGSEHPQFADYGNCQAEMWRQIKAASENAAFCENMRLIKTGEFIQSLRGTEFFNKDKGGLGLCRDGYHLSFNYGRYAAALVWRYFFTGKRDFPCAAVNSAGFETIRNKFETFTSGE